MTWRENMDKFNREQKSGVNMVLNKPVYQLTKDMEVIAMYHSDASASRETGISQGNICQVANGKRFSAGGFLWKRSLS